MNNLIIIGTIILSLIFYSHETFAGWMQDQMNNLKKYPAESPIISIVKPLFENKLNRKQILREEFCPNITFQKLQLLEKSRLLEKSNLSIKEQELLKHERGFCIAWCYFYIYLKIHQD